MKFILIVAMAVLSVASALPYEGIKGRSVIPKPENVTTSNKHAIYLDQTSMMNVNKEEGNKFQEQTTGTKITDQELINGLKKKETNQIKIEEGTNYSRSFDKIDHTLETHQGKSKVLKEEQMIIYQSLDSKLQENNNQSVKIETNHEDSSVTHYAGVKGGRRHPHH